MPEFPSDQMPSPERVILLRNVLGTDVMNGYFPALLEGIDTDPVVPHTFTGTTIAGVELSYTIEPPDPDNVLPHHDERAWRSSYEVLTEVQRIAHNTSIAPDSTFVYQLDDDAHRLANDRLLEALSALPQTPFDPTQGIEAVVITTELLAHPAVVTESLQLPVDDDHGTATDPPHPQIRYDNFPELAKLINQPHYLPKPLDGSRHFDLTLPGEPYAIMYHIGRIGTNNPPEEREAES